MEKWSYPNVSQDCLTRWKLEVEEDIRGLESAIKGIDDQIEKMYDDESLLKHEYQLHAVMVHEGSVDSGHYWAYVLDHKRKVADFTSRPVLEKGVHRLSEIGLAEV
jgi:ubiquitin C-terminal hydrolase